MWNPYETLLCPLSLCCWIIKLIFFDGQIFQFRIITIHGCCFVTHIDSVVRQFHRLFGVNYPENTKMFRIFQRSESSSIITTTYTCDFQFFFTNRLAQDQHFVRNDFQIKRNSMKPNQQKKILKKNAYTTRKTHIQKKICEVMSLPNSG